MAETYDVYKIAEEWMGVWVRTGPGVSYAKTHVIYGKDKKEYIVKEERKNKYWVKIEGVGWCCDRDTNGMIVLKKIKEEKVETVKQEPSPKTKQVDEETYAYVPTHELIVLSDEEFDEDLSTMLSVPNLRGIFGMPYQFMESVDSRLVSSVNKSDAIGRKYAKEIVSTMPLLLMVPGKPVFMGGYSDKDKKGIMQRFIEIAENRLESDISDTIFKKEFGKYYSLEPDTVGYFSYVNPMCRIAARVMGIHHEEIDGIPLDKYEWSENVNKNFTNLFSTYRDCTAWYCESERSISDSFGNDTTESIIASKINSLSEYGRELNFLLGTVRTKSGLALDKFVNEDNLTQNMQNVEDFINKTLGENGVSGLFSSITSSAQTVVAGGKLVFPEIWASSNFNRSYSINLKLVSPDADDLSLYLNIIVPMLHLLALALPRETIGSHGYISPFLVRAFYKGLFNVDMGIITSLSFNKGKEGAWSASGIPTVVDVDLTISDLYNDMYMSSMDNMKNNMLNNIILLDYISNLCGVNINEVDIDRAIDLFLTNNIVNRVRDAWHLKLWGRLENWVSNKWQNVFGRF